MNSLNYDTICDLAERFIATPFDETKRSIVDQLGLHPFNHARFAYRLCYRLGTSDITFTSSWLAYVDCVRYLDLPQDWSKHG